ncbi:transposase family protein [Streptomyces sp. NPDC056491]|uniref:helix-turn-helix domain-containing protein n=1 Tax=Streptomyces sp. NPDC056491 TaxID=3345837 RepID=UPI0036D0B95A
MAVSPGPATPTEERRFRPVPAQSESAPHDRRACTQPRTPRRLPADRCRVPATHSPATPRGRRLAPHWTARSPGSPAPSSPGSWNSSSPDRSAAARAPWNDLPGPRAAWRPGAPGATPSGSPSAGGLGVEAEEAGRTRKARSRLVLIDRLLPTLVHLRHGATHDEPACRFGVDRSTVTRAIGELRPLDHRRHRDPSPQAGRRAEGPGQVRPAGTSRAPSRPWSPWRFSLTPATRGRARRTAAAPPSCCRPGLDVPPPAMHDLVGVSAM